MEPASGFWVRWVDRSLRIGQIIRSQIVADCASNYHYPPSEWLRLFLLGCLFTTVFDRLGQHLANFLARWQRDAKHYQRIGII